MGELDKILETFDAERLTRLLDALAETAFEGAAKMANLTADKKRLKPSEGFNAMSIKSAVLAFVSVGLIERYDEEERLIYLAPALLNTTSSAERAALLQQLITGGEAPAPISAPPADPSTQVVEDEPLPSAPAPAAMEQAPAPISAPPANSSTQVADDQPSPVDDESPSNAPAADRYGAGKGSRLKRGSGAQKLTEAPIPYSVPGESTPPLSAPEAGTPPPPPTYAPPPAYTPPPTHPPAAQQESDSSADPTQSSRSVRSAPTPEPVETPSTRWTGRRNLPPRSAPPPVTPETPPPTESSGRTARTGGVTPPASTDEVPERLRNFQQRAASTRRPGGGDTGVPDVRSRGGVRGYGSKLPPSAPSAASGVSEDVLRLLLQSGLVSRNDAEHLLIDAPMLRQLLSELQSRLDALQSVGRDNDPTLQINLSELIAQLRAQTSALDAGTDDPDDD
jgi:hypothetical protein